MGAGPPKPGGSADLVSFGGGSLGLVSVLGASDKTAPASPLASAPKKARSRDRASSRASAREGANPPQAISSVVDALAVQQPGLASRRRRERRLGPRF